MRPVWRLVLGTAVTFNLPQFDEFLVCRTYFKYLIETLIKLKLVKIVNPIDLADISVLRI